MSLRIIPMKRILIAGLSVFFTTTLFADCADRIIDNASVLRPDQIQQISGAAQPLVNLGADVHFVTAAIGSMADLDAVEQQIEASCPSWSTAGERTPNLLLFVVAPRERKSGIYYGSIWRPALSDRWRSIRIRSMNPHFRDSDWTSGFIAAIEPTKSAINHISSESTVWIWLLWLTVTIFSTWLIAYLILRSKRKRSPKQEPAGTYSGVGTSTTIVHEHNYVSSNDGFVDGLIVGEILNQPQVIVERPIYSAPIYESPSPSFESSASYDNGSSFDSGGGSSDFGSSSDSGGSGDF